MAVVTSPSIPTMIVDNANIVELLEKQLYMQQLELIALGFISGAVLTILFVRWWNNG